MKVHVAVTQEDIELGEAQDDTRCPVALAVARATGKRYASVTQRNVAIGIFGLGDEAIFAPVSPALRSAIETFDVDGTMEPMEFDLTFAPR